MPPTKRNGRTHVASRGECPSKRGPDPFSILAAEAGRYCSCGPSTTSNHRVRCGGGDAVVHQHQGREQRRRRRQMRGDNNTNTVRHDGRYASTTKDRRTGSRGRCPLERARRPSSRTMRARPVSGPVAAQVGTPAAEREGGRRYRSCQVRCFALRTAAAAAATRGPPGVEGEGAGRVLTTDRRESADGSRGAGTGWIVYYIRCTFPRRLLSRNELERAEAGEHTGGRCGARSGNEHCTFT